MWFFQLILLLAVYSVGPGLFFLRRTRLAPAEKLVASVGLSYLLVYLGSFAWYLTGAGPRWQAQVSLGCLVLSLLSLPDLRALLAHRRVRRMLAAFGLFLLWVFVLLSFVHHYGGGTWSGDWLEHYQRSVFFLDHRPKDTMMIGLWTVPARPPMMNLIATSLMAQVGPQYDVFQVTFTFLNALVFLPAVLVAGNFVRRPARALPWVVLLLLAANPMVAQNVTYSWTKLFTAFYVLLGTHLYLRGWRKGSTAYLVLAFASLSAAFIVHHSAGPYAVFLGLHYATAVFWRGRRRWAEVALIGAVSAVILATWFGWSTLAYGPRTALASNSTVADTAVLAPKQNAVKVARNVLNTIVPRVIQKPSIMEIEELRQASAAGRVRDFTFLIYQVSLTFGLGSAGVVAVGYLVCGAGFPACGLREAGWKARTTTARRERWFWLAYVVVVCILGVAVHGAADRFGLAHICLQALIVMGLAFIAAGFRFLPAGLRWVLLAGLVLDLSLGVVLQFTMESRDFAIVQRPDGTSGVWAEEGLAQAPQFNWATKVAPELVTNKDGKGDADPLVNTSLFYWGDRFAGLAPVLQFAVVALFCLFAWLALRPAPVRAIAARRVPTKGNAPPRKRRRARR